MTTRISRRKSLGIGMGTALFTGLGLSASGLKASEHTCDPHYCPGRLGDASMSLKTDPRADPRMVAALAEFALDELAPAPAVTADSPLDEILDFITAAEKEYQKIFDEWFSSLPPVENVQRRTEVIQGVDGNEIRLFIHEPTTASARRPCIFHIHGGGMVLLTARDSVYVRWRDELAAVGLTVVGVDFRNGGGTLGNHPFPAGLNDCMSGLQWTAQNRAALGASSVVVSGDSGGGNLSLALTLKCLKDGRLDWVDGTYAMCPYISNRYGRKTPELPSLYENDDYFVSCRMMGAFALAYDPECENAENPLCWPYYAKASDLHKLPPHVISLNELDPLRDEGLAYYRKLMQAGVVATSRTVNGTCHAADELFRSACPDIYQSTIRDIRRFAESL